MRDGRRWWPRLAILVPALTLAACAPLMLRTDAKARGDRTDTRLAQRDDGEPPPLGSERPGGTPAEVTAPVAPVPAPSPEPSPEEPLRLDLIEDPTFREPVDAEASREAIIRVQVLLDRLRFSVGEIDGKFGRNTEHALKAFQSTRRLPPTGVVDEPTWTALQGGAPKILSPHLLTSAEASRAFKPLPRGMMARAKVGRLDYESGIEAVGERFHVSPELLLDLNEGKSFETAGEVVLVPNVRSTRGRAAAKVVVDASDKAVLALDDNGGLIAWYPSTMGSKHDPLPIGNWEVTYIARMPKFHYSPSLFWDAPKKDRPAVLPPGPNSPIGVVWIDLTKEHYGIHGTPEPRHIGHTQSHGCIRLTNWDASELARMIKPATPVVLRK